MMIAEKHGLIVIEDAAQAHLSHYKDRPLGTIGHFGCLSFHETKNIISGEGGALLVNDARFQARAEIIREKGTDRSRFFRGEIDKYTWLDVGSSYCPGEIVAAFLLAQLEKADEICSRRRTIYDLYRVTLEVQARRGRLVLPNATGSEANGHIFWTRVDDEETRTALLAHLAAAGVHAVFHYVPLHSAPAGRRFGRPAGSLAITDLVSQTLIRLPLHLQLTDDDVVRVASTIEGFFDPGKPPPPSVASPRQS
jgi:dTDP-4-amino-4,6-dideoxygalactose transaminase